MEKYIYLSIAFFALAICGCSSEKKMETEPGSYQAFQSVKTSDIDPRGWLKQFLSYQKEGLTGHIEAAGYPFDTEMWKERIEIDSHTEKEKDRSLEADGGTEEEQGVFWWPYEQTGYYIDGTIKAGYLLEDSMLLARARDQVYYTINHPRENGKLGPTKMIGRWFNWPYAGFFRSFITEYEETGDRKILSAMHDHYKHFTAEDFQDELEVCNVEELVWLFQQTGDSAMLNMAEESYALFRLKPENRNRDGRNIQFTSDRKPDYHGVVYFEIVKLPAILYMATGKEEYLEEALHGIKKMEKHNMLVSGVPSTTEHFNGISETAGHESCNLATLPYTYGIMLRATGDATWADKIERAVFNAAMGAITKDFTAHQYFSAPNQMISTLNSNHFGYYPSNMAYSPGQIVACCTGNINRFMPYYIMQMWMKTKNNGIVAVMFGPSEINTELGEDGIPVKIIQETGYPFDEKIRFTVHPEKKVAFDLQMRIPGWAGNARIMLNGRELKEKPVAGSFYSIHRKFSDGDIVELHIPMELKKTEWPNNGVAFERGPVVFSYAIPDSVLEVADFEKATRDFPAYEYYPSGDWQYSPVIEGLENIEVIKQTGNIYPWSDTLPPVKLRLKVRKIKNWDLNQVKPDKGEELIRQVSAFPVDPEFTGDTETIDLVPYGSTTLRLTVFPTK